MAVSQTPTSSGGVIVSCLPSPALPAGLSLSSACAITGTPTTPSSASSYTVTGTNTGGSTPVTISIAVNQVAPIISYSAPVTYQKGTAISTLLPNSSGGTISSCAITPALPTGLSFNTVNCAITGDPSAIQATTSYTVTATNSAGNGGASLSLTVNDIAPTLSYAGSPYAYPVGSPISTLAPTDSGGAITGCTVSPSLPAGLSLSPADCYITGTPTGVTAAASYSITATNSGGVAATTIVISVNSAAPNLNFSSGSTLTYTNGTAISTLTPGNTGGRSRAARSRRRFRAA